jgi:hypothetical protein
MKAERFGWGDADPVVIKYSGFGLEKLFDWVGHSGSLPGYNSEIFYNTVKKITIIVSANSVEGAPADVPPLYYAKHKITLKSIIYTPHKYYAVNSLRANSIILKYYNHNIYI